MRAWEKDKTSPPAIDNADLYRSRWSGHVIAPNGQDMNEVYLNSIPKGVVAAA